MRRSFRCKNSLYYRRTKQRKHSNQKKGALVGDIIKVSVKKGLL